MPIERFSFTELEKRLEEIELDIDKIEFISKEIVRCRNAIQDVKCEAKNIEPTEIKLSAKTVNQETSLVELVNSDKKIKRTITKKIVKICAKNLCQEYYDFLERSENHLVFYKTKLEARATWNECYNNEKEIFNIKDSPTRIVWKVGEVKLLALFDCLKNKECVPKLIKEEILTHFTDEKQNPFSQVRINFRKIIWLKSDNSFSIFVDELAHKKAIDEENKYKMFEKHFCNRNGKPFKYLAQKKNNTINYTETVKWIRKILDSVEIVFMFFVSQSNFGFNNTLGEYLKSISDYIIT
jgi:hypothetical protein